MEENDFNYIVKAFLKPLYNFVSRLVGRGEEAEDVVQEIFVKIWKNLPKFEGEISPENRAFKTWVFKIARNASIDYLRKKKAIKFSDLDGENESFESSIEDLEPLPDEVFSRKEIKKELEEAMSRIRPDFREIVILHYQEEMTFEEIGSVLGRPMNTVKSQYRRALEAMRKELLKTHQN